MRIPRLPPIKNRQCLEECGEPLSLKRYEKFVSALRNLIEDKRQLADPSMMKAIMEWEDLEIACILWEGQLNMADVRSGLSARFRHLAQAAAFRELAGCKGMMNSQPPIQLSRII
jgi:hypothetical protein